MLGSVAGNDRTSDCPDGGTDDPIRVDVLLFKVLVSSREICAERISAS